MKGIYIDNGMSKEKSVVIMSGSDSKIFKDYKNNSSDNKIKVVKNKSLSEEKVNYKDEVKKSGLEMIETKEK